MKNTLLRIIIASAVVTSTTQAALVVYNMDTSTVGASPASYVAANLTASNFGGNYPLSYAAGVSGNAVYEGGFGAHLSTVFLNFTFGIQPDSGYLMNISGFSFAEQGGYFSGPDPFPLSSIGWSLSSSIDSFASAIAVGSTSVSDFAPFSIPLSYGNLTTPVVFRLTASYGGPILGNGTTQWSVDNVSIDGTVSAIPEPTTLQLGLALCGLAVLRRRRTV